MLDSPGALPCLPGVTSEMLPKLCPRASAWPTLTWEAGSFPTRMECARQEMPITSTLPPCLCLRPTPTTAVSTILVSGGTGRLPTLRPTCIETILPQ
ncbi:unnamed protein product, partial [Gulo gulo]